MTKHKHERILDHSLQLCFLAASKMILMPLGTMLQQTDSESSHGAARNCPVADLQKMRIKGMSL
jgi:hypothetical protein